MRFLNTVKMNLLQLVTSSEYAVELFSTLPFIFFKTLKFKICSLFYSRFKYTSCSILHPICSTKKGLHISLYIFQVLVQFLFHVVEMTASHVNTITRSSFVNLNSSSSEEVFLLKLFGCMLTCLTHLLKSGLLSHH